MIKNKRNSVIIFVSIDNVVSISTMIEKLGQIVLGTISYVVIVSFSLRLSGSNNWAVRHSPVSVRDITYIKLDYSFPFSFARYG